MARRSIRILVRSLIWSLGILVGAFVLFVVPFLLVRNDAARDWMLREGVPEILKSAGIRVRIASVEGFDPWGLEMHGISLLRVDPQGREVEAARLGHLAAKWGPRDLLRRRLWIDTIEIDSARVWVEQLRDLFLPAEPRAPGDPSSQAAAGPPNLPWIRVRSIVLRGAQVWSRDTLLASGDAELRSVEHRSHAIEGRIVSVDAFVPSESLSVTLSGARVSGDLTRELAFDSLALRTPGLRGMLDGRVESPWGRTPPRGSARIAIDALRPQETAWRRKLPTLFSPRDSLVGSIEAEFTPGALDARLLFYGRLLDAPLSELYASGSLRGDTLLVEALRLRHAVGEIQADGEADLAGSHAQGVVRVLGVDLGNPALRPWLAGVPHTQLTGVVRGAVRYGPPALRVRGSGRFDQIEIDGRGGGPLEFAASYDGAILAVDSLLLGGAGGQVRAAGSWRRADGGIEGDLALEGLALEEWVEPWLHVSMAGRVSGSVRVTGTHARPRVEGRLEARDFQVVEVRADHVRVPSVAGTLVPLDLLGEVAAEDLNVYGAAVDSARFDVSIGRTVEVEGEARRRGVRASAHASIVPLEPGSLHVTRLDLDPGSMAPWSLAHPARVRWNAGAATIDSVAFESTDGRVEGWLDVGRKGVSLDGEVRFDSFDLMVPRVALGLPDSVLAGFVEGTVRIGGSATRPSGEAKIRGWDLVAARWPVGRLSASLGLEPEGTMRIDSLDAGTGGGAGRLRAAGLRAHAPVPLPRFLAAARDSLPWLIERTSVEGHLRIDQLSVARMVRTALESGPGRRRIVAGTLDPLSARIRTLHEEADSARAATESMGGRLSLEATFGGAAGAPELRAQGRFDELRFYQARADSVLFAVSYHPEELVLDSLVWHRDVHASRAHGTLPLVASLVPGRSRVPRDRPLDFEIELPEIDLGILGILSPQITEPSGFLSGSLVLRGTTAKIWPEGSLAVRDAGIRIPNREERISGVNGFLILDSTGVRIESLKGRIGSDGRLSISGTFTNLQDFYLEGEVRNATVYETGLYQFELDGDFRAFPAETETGSAPQVVGTVNVIKGTIVGDLAKAPPPPIGANRKPSPWRAEIDVFAPGNVRIQTAVASVDLGQAENLHVSYRDPDINVSGGLSVFGGRYRVFNNVFQITSGTVEFRDTGRQVEPILDVYAESSVTDYSARSDVPEDVRVQIHVVGPVSDLRLDFASTPERSTDEIIELLSVGRLREEGGSISSIDPSRAYFVTEAVSQIEAQVGQRFSALQNLSVRPGDQPGSGWQLNVRQSVLPQVSVAYTRELSTSADQEVSVHYNLRGQLYLNAGVQRRQPQGGAPVDRYLLDLKLRFEYK
jgi:hypothetical protein